MNKILLVIAILCGVLVHSVPVKRSFKVYHGDRLTSWSDNKFKFVVALFGESICSASIYSSRFLIFAGHCFQGEGVPSEVLFASVNVFDKTDQRISIKNAYLRKDYIENFEASQVNGRDMSVVELMQSIPLTKYDVTLAPISFTARPSIGATLTIVGYGKDTYRHLEAGTFNQGEMEVIQCPNGHFAGEPVCMLSNDKFKRQQNEGGDSGGPALFLSINGWIMVGVSSGFATYPDGTVVTVYASTAANREHIQDNTTA